MPSRDQLEVITSTGEIEFWDLDPARGITNIGRDAGNHIVINGSGVAPYHAVLDHRHRPYHLTVLSPGAPTRINYEPVPANLAREIHHRDTIEIGANLIVLLEGGPLAAGAESVAAQPFQAVPSEVPPAPAMPYAPAAVVTAPAVAEAPPVPVAPAAPAGAAAGRAVGLPARPADVIDDTLVAEMSDRAWTVDVDQTITFQVTVANGGDIVAAFWVWIEGLDQDWVTISPPQVNLNEGERATISVSITPPRQPSSRAGMHHFAVIVHSPNYPGRRCQRGATLTVNPYYEFAVGDLSPKQQSISWSRRSGMVTLPVLNRGNSRTLFRMEGMDDERACSFEFQVPGEAVSLATQAEMRLQPEELATIPVHISPLSRRLFALRKHTYSYTITTSLMEGVQAPRMVLGQLKASPLLGFWHMLLMMIAMMSCLFFLFIPGPGPRLYSEQGGRVSATENQLILSYNAARFAGWSPQMILNAINGWTANLTIERKLKNAPDNTYEVVNPGTPLSKPAGTITDTPFNDVVYRLTVRNWPSGVFPGLATGTTYDVEVVPVLPLVDLQPRESRVQLGQSIVLNWNMQYADRLLLKTQDGLAVETINEPEPSGSFEVKPELDTVYVLEAHNRYTGDTPESASATVKVFVPPTATPPPPVVEFFVAQPDRIVVGTPVVFNWRVSGAELVSIESDDPLDRPVSVGPAGPPISRQPTKTTLYTLKAAKGAATAVAYQQVFVQPAPTATPVPLAPVIEFFTISPDQIVKGSGDEIQLAWSVTGVTTNIEINGPDIPTVSGLPPLGALPFTLDTNTLFVLTAHNGDLSAAQTVQLKVQEPTATPPPPPVPPPPTATPLPPNIIFFKAAAADAADDDKVTFVGADPPTYEVVAGTKINLSWDVQNATKAVLSREGASMGDQPLQGSLPQTIKSDANYQMTGLNAQGDAANAQLSIDVTQQVPPAPTHLKGKAATNTIKLTWEYNLQDENKIVGFRIYRADLPPGTNFERVASQDVLTKDKRSWTDEIDPTCGKAYYAVAVYLDVVSGEERQTPASSNSWASKPCP